MALTAAMSFAVLFVLDLLVGEDWFYRSLGRARRGARALALFLLVLPGSCAPRPTRTSLRKREVQTRRGFGQPRATWCRR
jgi:hypothetical protein